MAKSKKKSKSNAPARKPVSVKKAKVKAAMVDVHRKTKKKRKKVKSGNKERENAQSAPSTNTFAHGSIVPFNATDTILLIGEGNFSFAAALFKRPELESLLPGNVYATVNDSENVCVGKYAAARRNTDFLKEKGVNVLFDVDATALGNCSALAGKRFDRVMWNFPHLGHSFIDLASNIHSNRALLLGFLRSVPPFLSKEPGLGTVLITLRDGHPYTEWKLCELAEKSSLPTFAVLKPMYTLVRSFMFKCSDWPGYQHKLTRGEHGPGPKKRSTRGEDRTWEFCLRQL